MTRQMPETKFSRRWSMPSADTFSIGPVAALLDRVLAGCQAIVDPFARNSTRGTFRNDLNPTTTAQHHLNAVDFLDMLTMQGITADAVLFDPPYSPRQISEVYASVGLTATTEDTQNARLYRIVKARLSLLLKAGGVAICCGWNSGGLGGPSYVLEEVLLVPHGSAHNDTIVTVERKQQGSLI